MEKPLLSSGLALAGANRGMKGEVGPDGEDGILYGLEALGLNLKGTKLVTFSACNTGLGIIDKSEGVYGLVRALRIAGAESVIMTLWPLMGKETKKFMEIFYENYLVYSKHDPADALRITKLYHIRTGKDPKVWAPYVLIGK